MPPVSVISPRLDSKPWGGQRLTRFGFPISDGETIGEALVTAGDAVVASGVGVGSTLDDIVANEPVLIGREGSRAVGGKRVFPLLVKLIDASQNLSIQNHPNDEQAAPVGKFGKTEAWHVLAVDAGARLYLGVSNGVTDSDLRTAADLGDGSMANLCRVVSAAPGRTILIPAGTVHALGAGVLVYEIQQPSDITYRLDDWGRRDVAGNPREMHIEAGLAVARLEQQPAWIDPARMRSAVGERHLLTSCRYFALERLALPGGGSGCISVPESPAVVTILEGRARLGDHVLPSGTSAVVWATAERVELEAEGPVVALIATVPDQEALGRSLDAVGLSPSDRAALTRPDL